MKSGLVSLNHKKVQQMLKNPVLEAKGIWKGYEDANRSYCWILKELNL